MIQVNNLNFSGLCRPALIGGKRLHQMKGCLTLLQHSFNLREKNLDEVASRKFVLFAIYTTCYDVSSRKF